MKNVTSIESPIWLVIIEMILQMTGQGYIFNLTLYQLFDIYMSIRLLHFGFISCQLANSTECVEHNAILIFFVCCLYRISLQVNRSMIECVVHHVILEFFLLLPILNPYLNKSWPLPGNFHDINQNINSLSY